MVIFDVHSFSSTIDVAIWFALFFLGTLWGLLVYSIIIFSSIPRRSPRNDPRYARLVVRVQLAFGSVREME